MLYYTAKEVAGLPGLPGTGRGVQVRADREGWPNREREGRGGGREYPALASLLTKIKGQFLLSLNDTPEIRAIFSAFTIEEIDTRYSCSNKRNNRVQELLIRNF